MLSPSTKKYDSDDLYQEAFLKAEERMDDIDTSINPESFLISLNVGS